MKRICANCVLYDSDTKQCVDCELHEPGDGCQCFVGTESFKVGALMPEPDLTLKQVEDWCDRHNYVLVTKEFAESRGF